MATSVTTSLEFLADDPKYNHEKPYWAALRPKDNSQVVQESNITTIWRDDIHIEDVRPFLGELSFEENAFKYIQHSTLLGTRFSEDELQEDLEDVTELLRKTVDAEKGLCYDIRTRSRNSQCNCEQASENRAVVVKPVSIAHTDHSKRGGLRRIAKHLTEKERAKYLTGNYRCRIFNVWKPLIDVVEDNPLALCDPRSVDNQDLVPVDRVTEEWAGEIYYLNYNKKQRWKFLNKQRRDELCIFVSFDSAPSARINFCPHASFINPLALEGSPPRESVEVRVIMFNKVAAGHGAVFDSTQHESCASCDFDNSRRYDFVAVIHSCRQSTVAASL